MGSKRSKKLKQELELFPEKNNIKKIKDEDVSLEPEINNFDIENKAAVPAVVPKAPPAVKPKAPKRKKKNDGIDVVPKKLKKINDNGNDTKKVKPRKRKSKSDSILSTGNIENGGTLPMNGEFKVENDAIKIELTENNIPKNSKNNLTDKDKKKEEITWPDQDISELISRMESNIPEKDILAYRSRVEKLNWNNVAFKDYTAEQCKSTWMLVQKRIRCFRLLSELLSDAKEWISSPRTNHTNSRTNHKPPRPKKHPDMPRRPLSSYLLFYLKTKDQIISENPGLDGSDITKIVGQIYKNLPPESREKYEKLAATNKEEYLEKLKIFFEKHPEIEPPPTKINHKVKVEKEKTTKAEKQKPFKSEKSPKIIPKVGRTLKGDKEKVTKIHKSKSKGVRGRPSKIGSLRERPPKKCQTPFGLYYSAELKNMEPGMEKQVFRDKCKMEYKQMPDKKKMCWITLAEQDLIRYQEEVKAYRAKYPEFRATKVRPILTKKEKVTKERASGKPIKPPNSAYALYSRVMLQSDEIKSIHPKERMNFIASKWKNAAEEEKKIYGDQVISLNEEYKQQYQFFLNSLPEDERRKLLPKPKSRLKIRRSSSSSSRIRKAKKRKSVKKENKPPPAPKLKFTEPEQPPISACKYFASLYKDEGDPIQAWKALPPEQKRQYEEELVKKKQAYIVEFERFLKSLSKEELEAFSKSRQQQIKSEDEESSECSSGSEGDDEDDDDDEDEENGEENEENGEENNSENIEIVKNEIKDEIKNEVKNNGEDVHESDTD